ncbi:MAG: hypothetical protein ACTSRP_07420 [Candidatus Helarchaeota archaeon]
MKIRCDLCNNKEKCMIFGRYKQYLKKINECENYKENEFKNDIRKYLKIKK